MNSLRNSNSRSLKERSLASGHWCVIIERLKCPRLSSSSMVQRTALPPRSAVHGSCGESVRRAQPAKSILSLRRHVAVKMLGVRRFWIRRAATKPTVDVGRSKSPSVVIWSRINPSDLRSVPGFSLSGLEGGSYLMNEDPVMSTSRDLFQGCFGNKWSQSPIRVEQTLERFWQTYPELRCSAEYQAISWLCGAHSAGTASHLPVSLDPWAPHLWGRA